MVRAVVFDLGKVLVDFDYTVAARRLAARGNMAAEEIIAYFSQTPLLLRYEAGLLTNLQFFNAMCAVTGYGGDIEEFGLSFGDIFVPIEPMVQLQGALRKKGFPTYVFSNTNDLAVAHIRRSFPFFSNFDGYILSYQHGAMKPQPEFYEVLEKQSGRKGAEILYLDDRPENIAAGAARGWQVILHETPEKSLAAIRRLNLLGQNGGSVQGSPTGMKG